jgi:glutamate-5-semialdehyde dehydrogenase
MDIQQAAAGAKKAATQLAAVSAAIKNAALTEIARALKAHAGEIVAANLEDLQQAERDNLAPPLLKRLRFDQSKIDAVCCRPRSPDRSG